MALALEQWPKSTGSIGQAGEWNNLKQEDLLYSVIEWNGLIGTDGKDNFQSTNDDCVVHAGAERDQIKTLGGDDVIYAGSGDDRISSGGGNDLILGGAGVDVIDAGSGDDIVVSGAGNEKVKGGAGRDMFVLNSLDAGDVDTILDFNPSQDKLILDSTVFTAFKKEGDEGEVEQVLANEFIKGAGYVKQEGTGYAYSNPNITGVDDYLIFDTRGGRLYYDEDGNKDGATPELIAVFKGKATSLDFDNFVIV